MGDNLIIPKKAKMRQRFFIMHSFQYSSITPLELGCSFATKKSLDLFTNSKKVCLTSYWVLKKTCLHFFFLSADSAILSSIPNTTGSAGEGAFRQFLTWNNASAIFGGL
jgi:hypothetical protein